MSAAAAPAPTAGELEAAIREALEGSALEDITQRSLRATVRGCVSGAEQQSGCFDRSKDGKDSSFWIDGSAARHGLLLCSVD